MELAVVCHKENVGREDLYKSSLTFTEDGDS
jgi:hypothetical protein